MRKFWMPLALVVVTSACKKENQVSRQEQGAGTPPERNCYQGVLKKDTISLAFVRNADEITGTLRYRFFEKDSNQGTITGKVKGDTIFADYTFNSEGVQSVREVAFLQQGNAYIEGYGDVVRHDGAMRFKDVKTIKFDSKTILLKTDCP